MSKEIDPNKELIKETIAYLKNHKPSKYEIKLKKELNISVNRAGN